jgi:DNA-binding NtrC family response regulator
MRKYSILIIDDEPIIVSAVRSQLENHFGDDISIETALSAEDGLHILEEISSDVPVVICDYRMPGIKGDRLIAEIHKHYPQILTILLTGQIDIEGFGHIVNEGRLFRYIAKPWNEVDLILTIKEAIHTYQLSRLVKIQNKQIVEYAFQNSHNVRGPLARIMGLVDIMKRDPEIIPEERLIDQLDQSANELDNVIRKITITLADKSGQLPPSINV